MPRGRPKGSKNKSTLVKEDISTVKIVEEKTEVKSKVNMKPLKVNCYCDLCGAPIYSAPFRVQLQNLTGKATWHRECKLDKMSICNGCAKELNDIIDKFVLKKNPSLNKIILDN